MTWPSSPFASGTLGTQTDGPDEITLTTNYVGRLIVIRRGAADEEYAVVASNVSGNLYKIDRNWEVTPSSGDAYAIGHNAADGFTAGDYDRVSNTQEWYVQKSQINMTGTFLLGLVNGVQVDTSDVAQSTTSGPYIGGSGTGLYVVGAQFNTRSGGSGATDGNQLVDVVGTGRLIFDNASINSVQSVKIEADSATSKVEYHDSFDFKSVHENHFDGALKMRRTTRQGTGLTTQRIRVNGQIDADDVTLKDMYGWFSLNNSVADTIVIRGYRSIGASRDVEVFNQKTWEFIDAIMPRLATFTGTTNSRVREGNRVLVTVTDPAGSALQDVRQYIYEGTENQDLPTRNQQSSSVSGVIDSDIITEEEISSGTTLFGGFVLGLWKFDRLPFISALSPDPGVSIIQPVSQALDTNQTAANAAAALAAVTGVTHSHDTTNPNSLIDYTAGAGTLSGTVTATPSGAVGTFQEIFSGDSVAGRAFLKSRNGIAFASGDSLSNGAGWTATYTASSELRFTWHIDDNNEPLQDLFNYLHAKYEAASPDAIFLEAIEWSLAGAVPFLMVPGAAWKTLRSTSPAEGVYISNRGPGLLELMTADDGTTITPLVQTTVTVKGLQNGAEVRAYVGTAPATAVEIGSGTANVSGEFQFSHEEGGNAGYLVIRDLDFDNPEIDLTWAVTDQELFLSQGPERSYGNAP